MTVLLLPLLVLLAQAGEGVPPGIDGRTLAIQVALDKAGFSPGVIDGADGANTRRAAEAFRRHRGTEATPDPEPLVSYTITEADAAAAYAPAIPEDLVEQAELPALAYTSIVEALAERFHASPALLARLNRGARFAAGDRIRVPGVPAFIVPAPRVEFSSKPSRSEVGTAGRRGADPAGRDSARPDVVVTVSRSASSLIVRNDGGEVILFAPVTTGSEHDPLPIGEWKVTGVQYSPEFHYNPQLFWDADPAHAKATIRPGPNNPVGVVWIDLSKEHYGLHGTPEPAAVGRSTSHGCVRLTNWDALRLAGLVKPGTKVVFTE